jgi:hypothetical protein
LGSGASQFCTLLTVIATARLLGASAFGELGMVLLTVSLCSTLATFGLDVTATKYVAECRRSDPERAGSLIGALLGTVTALGLVSAALMVTPWPFLALAYYVFAGTCLAAAIGRARVDGPAWLLVAIGGIGLYVFNTEDDRAWLWIPFGLAWIVVGLLHLARVSAVDPPTQSPELTVSVP